MMSREASLCDNSDVNPYAKEPTWLRTWLAIEAMAWRSLAVIPTYEGSSFQAVHGFAAVAWEQQGPMVTVADFRAISLPALATVREEIRKRTANGERIIIACRSLHEDPIAATIAREADAVLLCIILGRSRRKSVVESIEEVGKERIVGTVSLRLDGG